MFDKRIAVASESTEVISSCEYCSTLYDQYADDRRCTRCRSLVLACGDCQVRLDGVYQCTECTVKDKGPQKELHGGEVHAVQKAPTTPGGGIPAAAPPCPAYGHVQWQRMLAAR